MGFIRGGLLFVISVILIISLLIGNIFFVFSSSLKYENINSHLGPVMSDLVEKQINLSSVEEGFSQIQEYCKTHDDFVLGEEGYVFVLSCEEVINGTPENVIASESSKFLEKIYYKNYECGFFDCFKEGEVPFFLISQKTQKYIQNKFYYSLLISLILMVLMFFFVQSKKNWFFLVGSLLIFTSLPFSKLDIFSSFSSNEYVVEMFSLFFSSAWNVFLIMFLIGIVLITTGIAFKLWDLEEFLKNKGFFGKHAEEKPAKDKKKKN